MATDEISTTANEPAFRTWTERREQITKEGDADDAINEVLGALHAIHGQAHLLCQDTVRDKDTWVLSIAHAIMELADASRDFLDRPGGWAANGTATEAIEPSSRLAHQIMDEISDMTATVEKFDLHEQEDAIAQLPQILEQAKQLATRLNDLCNSEHLPASRLASEGNPSDIPDRDRDPRFLRSGLTIRDVAQLFRAHPRAIEALIAA
jgi:hypothetical protein